MGYSLRQRLRSLASMALIWAGLYATPALAQVDLAVTITDAPDPVQVSAEVEYTLAIANSGVTTATGVDATVFYPPALTPVVQATPGWTCVNASVVSCTLTSSAVAGGATAPLLRLRFQAPTTAQTVQISATAGSIEPDTNSANNTNVVQQTSVIAGIADLTLAATPSVASATAGTPVSFTLQVGNLGPGSAPSLQVNGTLTGAITFSSFSSSPSWNCSHSTGVIACSYTGGSPAGTLPPGVTAAAIVVNGIAGPAAGIANLTATAGSAFTDPTPANANASITVTGAAAASVDLALQQTVVGAQPIPRGVPFTYRLTVVNSPSSNQTGSGIQINDPLPAGIALQSFAGAGWTCTGAVQCSYASTLSPGQSSNPLDLVVVYNQPVPVAGANVSNTATVSGAEPDPTPANNQSTAVASLISSADVAVGLTGSSSVIAGGPLNIDLTAINNGADDAANVSVSTTISAGFTVGAVSGGAGWSCLASGQTVSCTRPALPVGSSPAASLALTAPATPGGPFNQTANISTSSFDPQTSNNATTLPVSVGAALATLSLTKTDSVDPVVSGNTLEYVLTVSNTGNVSQNNFVLTDNLPPELTYQSFSGAGWNCSAAPVAGTTVSCTQAAALAPGANSVVRIRARADGAATATNHAQVSSAQSAAPALASESTTIIAVEPLIFEKHARAASVAVGDSAFFDLVVENPGQVDAQGLVLLDDLPPGMDAVAATGDGWTCTINGARIDCRRATLARFGRTTIAVETRPRSAGNFNNRAQLTSLGAPAALIASDSVTAVDSRSRADLVLEKTDSVDPVSQRGEFEYRLSVQNLGPDPASGVRLSDPLPAQLTALAASGPGWSCTLGAQVSCDLSGTLAVGASAVVTLRVRADAAGTVINTATASATELDDNPGNNVDTESTLVQPLTVASADLELSVTGPANARAGDNVELVVLARNQGPDTAASVLLRTQVSGPWVLESGSAAGFVCVASSSAIECRSDGLAAGAVADVRLRGRVNANASSATPMQASLALVAATNDPNPADNAASVSFALVVDPPPPPPPPQTADLVLTKVDSADPVAFGERYSYTISVRNLGPAAASGILIVDPLPAGVQFVSAAGAGFTCTGSATVECRAVAPLAVGAQLAATVTVDAGSQRQTINNIATVSATTTDPVSSNNQAQQSTLLIPPEGGEAEDALAPSAVGDALASEAVAPVVALCDGSTGTISRLCDALYSDAAAGRDAQVQEALRSLYPEEVLAQFTSLNQVVGTQFSNIDARMTEVRSGGSGLSLSGLTMIRGSQTIPFGLLKDLLQAGDEVEVGGPGDLVSPWGFFVNGTISRGDQQLNPGDRDVVLDFDSVGITAGVDYRRDARWVVGGALGYNRFKSQLTDAGGLDTRGYTLTGYSAYSLTDRVYWDSRLSYGRVQLDQQRRLRIGLNGFTLDDRISSATDASQFALATSVGYVLNRGAWTFTPNAFLRYMRSNVDGFAESGSEFAVSYGDQQVSSMVYGAGVQVSRVISLSNGVLTPQFDLVWNQETRNDDTVIDAAFVGGDAGEFFMLRPETPDRSYGSVGLGMVYIMANGRQAYIQWRESIGVDGLDRSTLNLGARFEF